MKLTPAFLSLVMFVVVGGLIAAYVAKSLFATEEAPAPPAKTTIPMAMADIPAGTIITEAHIGSGFINPNDVEPTMLRNNRVIIGRVAKNDIPANTAFHSIDMHPPGYREPLHVREGMRAVSVSIDRSSDVVSGLINPGEYVDVHMTVDQHPDPRVNGGLTLTLFRGVQIIAMTGSDNGGGFDANSVTLELTPEQANIMILARDRGAITLTLNPDGQGDGVVDVPDEHRATLEQILGLRALPEPERPFQTEHFDGSARQVLEWRDNRRIDWDDYDRDDQPRYEPIKPADKADAKDGPSV
ncbi:Flp pilus assembly protein CpaB [Calycomorphotria hydatis]|uniref:Flp pilus assembly protein RcpC/CpaB domain-containing protein n=1 Tax=Calycomorphotria hydatis TaxID=2528027 RepID=A0A517TAH9_9PLAN|nr:Flp pilus assembly protein CpaB [Calycomorphotria hydatis]QDT65380.1 hypothetical protein V22_26330 [Calycomorphotria hydatis]